MIRITCTSCQKPLSLDETKLPMKEVAFPCPVCKVKLTVDRRVLEGGAAPAPSEPTAPLIESSETHGPDDDHENDFGSKAMIVGNDSPAIRQAVKLIGFLPVLHADPEEHATPHRSRCIRTDSESVPGMEMLAT